MTAIHGKNAIIYLSASGASAASPLTEQGSYSIDATFALPSTAELGDTFETFVKGLLTWKGKIDGNFDTAGNVLFAALTSSTPSNFYLYPDRGTAANYYYGTCWVEPSTIIGGGVTDKAKTSVSITGDGPLSVH